MKIFPIAMTISNLATIAYAENMEYCNANTAQDWILYNAASAPSWYEDALLPNACQTYPEGSYRNQIYCVCDLEIPVSSGIACELYCKQYGAGYVGDLYVGITNSVPQASFVPQTNDDTSQNMVAVVCQTGSASYNIFVNTTENIPPCDFSDDTSSNSSDGNSVNTQAVIIAFTVIGALVGGLISLYCCMKFLPKAIEDSYRTWERHSRTRQKDEHKKPLLNKVKTIPRKDIVIGEELGRGGFGIVYKGTWHGSEVAIKQFQKTGSSFEYEAKLLSKLDHRNIVEFFGVCIENNNCFIIMKCMSMSLFDALYHKAWSSYTALPKVSIARDIENGLQYLHDENVIHGDMKSLNVLINEATGEATLCDFGLANIKTSLSSLGVFRSNKFSSMPVKEAKAAGTPRWMAPELFRGMTCSKTADVYAFGMILYELVSEKVPFENIEKNTEVITAVLANKRPEVPASMQLSINSLAALMTKCWQERAEYRPKHNEIQKDLESISDNNTSILEKTATTINPYSDYERFSRFV